MEEDAVSLFTHGTNQRQFINLYSNILSRN